MHSCYAKGGGMQMRFCYAPHAWLNYRQNIIFDFTFFEIVGIFLILYNFPIKILRRYKNLILPFVVFLQQCPILCSLFRNLTFITYLFLRQCIYRKDGKRFSGFLFGDSFSAFFYMRRKCPYIADCKRLTENKIKLETIFLAFQNALI